MIDFKLDFAAAADRLQGEADERRALADRIIPFNVSFLDDIARGILPNDLVLLGAWTGAGKTQLASNIAQRGARAGRRVTYFALEAEPREIERRMKYRCLADRAWRDGRPGVERLNYPDWYLGRCDDLVADYVSDVEGEIAEDYKTLRTYYRGASFTTEDMERLFRAEREHADLIVLDHLHYVDSGDDDNENRAVKRTVMGIRDASLATGIPALVVAHLRKRDRGRRQLVPDLDDFHGTSDITKIATKVIMLAPARDQQDPRSWIAPTYVHVPKDRMAGTTGLVALVGYDLRTNSYESTYQLGRTNMDGSGWEQMDITTRPRWAHSAFWCPPP